jgi:FdhD protein
MTNPPPPTVRVSNWAFSSHGAQSQTRDVPEETPIALTYGRNTHAVMLATPADLEDFAVGFSLSEGLIKAVDDITALEVVQSDFGIELRMDLSDEELTNYSRRRRALVGPTGCGLCGLESLSEVAKPFPKVESEICVSPTMIVGALELLFPAQEFNHRTRAMHAAGFWSPNFGMMAVREDVGRHNALDKLVGALARKNIGGRSGVVAISSRVSVEMVQKTARLGAAVLVAVSAPTALAIRTAEACGITMIAVARGDEFEIFTHPDRIALKAMKNAG